MAASSSSSIIKATSVERALTRAARNGNIQEVLRLLKNKRLNVNACTDYGMTALHVACEAGKEDVVLTLIRGGAAVDAVDSDGWSPLLFAVHKGHLEVVRTLLAHGAAVNAPSKFGTTALHLACDAPFVEIAEVLLEAGVSVNVTDCRDETPLHRAAWFCHQESTRLVDSLVAHGADLNAVTNLSMTPLHSAAYSENTTVIETLLRRHGANVSATDRDNATPLEGACDRLKFAAAEALETFICDLSDEWRPSRHTLYPLTFSSAVTTVLSLWSWNHAIDGPWHPESPFVILSLELLYEVFVWLAFDILTRGYIITHEVRPSRKSKEGVKKKSTNKKVVVTKASDEKKAEGARRHSKV